MATSFNWTCPHCGGHSTIQEPNYRASNIDVILPTAKDDEGIEVWVRTTKCPSPICGKFTFDVSAKFGNIGPDSNGYQRRIVTPPSNAVPVGLGHVRFLPRVGKPLSPFVPGAVKEDYEEACTIRDLSPKAAATLCRRALQGMVRDFWQVNGKTLHAELQLIEPKCDPDLFKALMGVKSIGNIGAHPEMDINIIVDVEPGEVDALINVLQILDADWYVARAAKAKRLAEIHGIAAAKAAQKIAPTAAALPAPPSAP